MSYRSAKDKKNIYTAYPFDANRKMKTKLTKHFLILNQVLFPEKIYRTVCLCY